MFEGFFFVLRLSLCMPHESPGGFSFFATDLPESVIKRLSIRVKESHGVNLGQGIPSFPTASHIRAAARKALDEKNIGVYPNFLGTMELREAIITKLNRTHKTHLLANENILVTVGAMEGAATTILSIVENGDRVGVITPDYCNHFPEIMLARGEIVEIPMLENNSWHLDFASIEKEAKKGLKMLLLTNPSNPTGAVIVREDMERLVKIADRYGIWLVVDETYWFLTYKTPRISLLDVWDRSERLIVLRSFSKEYAMTGWRVGYVIAKKEVIAIFARTHDALTGCVPKISQEAALAAVSGPQSIVKKYCTILEKRRGIAVDLLSQMSDVLSFAEPQGAYYIFPKVKATSGKLSEVLLKEANVAVIPGYVFGKAGEGHIRISFAVEDETLVKGLLQIRDFFSRTT